MVTQYEIKNTGERIAFRYFMFLYCAKGFSLRSFA